MGFTAAKRFSPTFSVAPLFNLTLLLLIKHFLMSLMVTDIGLAAGACFDLYTDANTPNLKTKPG